MSKYLISYAVVSNRKVIISAESMDDAENKFYRGEFDEGKAWESEFIDHRLEEVCFMDDVSTATDIDERGTYLSSTRCIY